MRRGASGSGVPGASVRVDGDVRVRGRGQEPCGDAHGEHAEGRGLAAVVGEEPGGPDYEGAAEGADGVVIDPL